MIRKLKITELSSRTQKMTGLSQTQISSVTTAAPIPSLFLQTAYRIKGFIG